MEQLNEVEVRVLGSLIEKQITTPEYYPLTLNSLTAACNQKSNREPVVEFEGKTVVRALDSLRERDLVHMVSGAEMRVPKYRHTFTEKLGFDPREVGALCVLMLRGPQTVGEIRGRSGRLCDFGDLQEVERILQGLAQRADGPLVRKLPRQVGRKEPRFAHLLAGEPEIPSAGAETPVGQATLEVRSENERLEQLEEQVVGLRGEMDSLRRDYDSFRKQFD